MLKRFAAAVAIALPFTLGVQLAHAQLSKAPGKPDFTAELIVGGIDQSDPEVAWAGVHIRLARTGTLIGGPPATPARRRISIGAPHRT